MCFLIAVVPDSKQRKNALGLWCRPSRNGPKFKHEFSIGDVMIQCRFPISGAYLNSNQKFKNGLRLSRP